MKIFKFKCLHTSALWQRCWRSFLPLVLVSFIALTISCSDDDDNNSDLPMLKGVISSYNEFGAAMLDFTEADMMKAGFTLGDVISITGYRKKDNDANGNLYILFEKGASIDEGDNVTWNNIHENVGQQPNTNTYEVSAEAAGSKTIKLARSQKKNKNL